MESIVILLLIALTVLIIIPIILLVKISSIKSGFDHIDRRLEIIEIRLNTLLNKSASKQDIREMLEITEKPKEKSLVAESIKTDTVAQTKPEIKQVQPEVQQPIAKPVIGEKKKEEPVIKKQADVYVTESIRPVPSIKTEKKPEPAFSPISESLRKNIQPVSSKDFQEKSFFEKITSDNWLSKVGIVTLVLGIGFFVKYAIDQNWINEIGRVGIGLLTGGIIIAVAGKLKSKYHVFSSILTGGGISVFYITITLAFREYELFGQTVAFIVLIIITVFSVILSLLYDRKELAVFSLLGGFASPLMVSTGTGYYVVLFSYILILNTGMLLVSFRKKWRVIGVICYVLTTIFYWSWLLLSFESEFKGATTFGVLFFAQFYLLALIDHFKSEKKTTAYQAVLILTNNLSFFTSCIYIFSDYSYDVKGIVTISIAVINAIVPVILFQKNTIDRNLIYLVIAVVLSFVSLAVPIQLNGHVITLFWSAEAVLLLWFGQKSGIKIFRIGFLIISFLTVVSYVMDAHKNYGDSEFLPIVFNPIFITGITVTASFSIILYLLKKEIGKNNVNTDGHEFQKSGNVLKVFTFLVILFSFTVPLLELNHQLALYSDIDYISSFRYMVLASYVTLYASILAIIYRNDIKSSSFIFGFFLTSTFLYTMLCPYLSTELRFDIFYSNIYPKSYFLIHFLDLFAISTIIYLLTKNVKSSFSDFKLFCISTVILSVIILSVEIDNIVIMLLGNKENYRILLYDVHTFGYPILWGIIAMVLMIWGLKQKEVLLRKISLIFFGFIMLKFYAYDVWHMSQAGRIVSFVILGIILLSVSFLQQKIKTLVKSDDSQNDDRYLNK